jgi:hypothetical protein
MSLDVPKKTTKKDGTIGQIIIIVIGIITLGFVTSTVIINKRKKKKAPHIGVCQKSEEE